MTINYTIIFIGITIGFEQTLYPTEEDTVIKVCARILNGSLEKDVIVKVSSSDGSATGKLNDHFLIWFSTVKLGNS